MFNTWAWASTGNVAVSSEIVLARESCKTPPQFCNLCIYTYIKGGKGN